MLGIAGLNFPSAGGTPADPGLIYDSLTATQIEGTELTHGGYQMFWMNGDAFGAYSSTAHDNIRDYVEDGGGMIASGNAILEMECYGCTDTDCSKGACSASRSGPLIMGCK